MVLLGIRTSVREDSGLSPAELVYGSALHLPGEFLAPPEAVSPVPSTSFVDRLRRVIAVNRPPPAVHHHPLGPRPSIPSSLADVSHVFVRVDAVRRPLTRPYAGPYEVLSRTPKTFVLSKAGAPWTVSVDRLKPAWGLDSRSATTPFSSARTRPDTSAPPSSDSVDSPPAPTPVISRSGRVVRPPARFS